MLILRDFLQGYLLASYHPFKKLLKLPEVISHGREAVALCPHRMTMKNCEVASGPVLSLHLVPQQGLPLLWMVQAWVMVLVILTHHRVTLQDSCAESLMKPIEAIAWGTAFVGTSMVA